jgi:hypothetical protein
MTTPHLSAHTTEEMLTLCCVQQAQILGRLDTMENTVEELARKFDKVLALETQWQTFTHMMPMQERVVSEEEDERQCEWLSDLLGHCTLL